MKVAAVIVTYNRKKLLEECLKSVINQTYSLNEIIVIDNNSSDGTYEYLKEKDILKKINYIKLEKNIGGSGGFYEGMKIASEKKYDWVWIMDDDTIPNEDCLENLIKPMGKIEGKISFLASCVFGEKGEFMNVPAIDNIKTSNGYAGWYKYLKFGIVSIKDATFVSLLINGEAIQKCGLPIKSYFLWGDDTEYTMRITKYFGKAYLIGDSIAIHKRKNAKHTTILLEEDEKRIPMYYYMIRNNLINAKLYGGKKGVLKSYIKYLINSIMILFSNSKHKGKKVLIIHKGILAYFFRRYNYKEVKNRFYI